jgi:hypothetical protein
MNAKYLVNISSSDPSLRRKEQNEKHTCGDCLIFFILGCVIFEIVMSSLDRKPNIQPVPANKNIAKFTAKQHISVFPAETTNTNKSQEFRQKKKVARKWYEGGNLHHADLATWKKASYENKLATAADWAFATLFVKRIYYQSKSVEVVKPFAIYLVECIDKETSGIDTQDKPYEIAAICSVLMGWDK